MRELVLDTETTGLDFLNGDRIVEIGIVELENHIQTGNYFHYYLNPEKDSSFEALKVHGFTREFLSDKLKFKDIADEFVEFIGDSKIIIHNASFDLGFINTELEKCNIEKINEASIIDTLVLAKNKFRGQSVSLDSLCRKYNIDIRDREIHGTGRLVRGRRARRCHQCRGRGQRSWCSGFAKSLRGRCRWRPPPSGPSGGGRLGPSQRRGRSLG